MITIAKAMEMIREDLNQENSYITGLFGKITSILFLGVILLSIPLFTYMLIIFI